MEQRVSLITLGVADVEAARAFYYALGWRSDSPAGSPVVFFQAGGLVFALWDGAALAADVGATDAGGFGGVALAHNVRWPSEVDALLKHAQNAGATIAREASQTSWGGYSGVFADLDGHLWEVAYNPHWTLNVNGTVSLSSG